MEYWSNSTADFGMLIAEFKSTFQFAFHSLKPETGNPPEWWESQGQISNPKSEIRNPKSKMVPPAGLEPATPGLGIRSSIRLSYGGIWDRLTKIGLAKIVENSYTNDRLFARGF